MIMLKNILDDNLILKDDLHVQMILTNTINE